MVKHVPRLLLLLLALCLLSVAAALGWVSSRPRDMASLVPRIEAALTPSSGAYRVSIEGGELDWRLWRDVGRITLHGVRMESPGGKAFAKLSQIKVRLSAASLLSGRIGISRVIIPTAAIVLTRDNDRTLYLGFNEDTANIPLLALFAEEEDPERSEEAVDLPFAHAVIENAQIFIRDAGGELLLRTEDSRVAFDRTPYGMQATLDARFLYSEQEGSAVAIVRYYRRGQGITAASKLVNMPIGLICGLAGQCGDLSGVRGAITGQAAFNVQGGDISEANVTLIGQRMHIDRPEWFAEPLAFDEMAVSAKALDNMRDIHIEALSLKNEQIDLIAAGSGEQSEAGWSIKLAASMKEFNLRHLYRYWPVSLAPQTRDWVATNINKGISPQSSVAIELKPEDFKAEFFPDNFLKAEIAVQGATVKYLQGLAPVTSVDGTVVFTGETMRARLSSGKLLSGTTLGQSEIYCPDLNNPDTPMNVQLGLNAKASDVAQILRHKAFAFDDKLQLDPASIQGAIAGDVKLGFNAFSDATPKDEVDLSGVDYAIDARFEGLSQKGVMGKFSVANANGTLKADASNLQLSAKADINASAIDVVLSQPSGEATNIDARGEISRASLVAYGMPDRRELKEGNIAYDASVSLDGEKVQVNRLALDLKKAAIVVPDISWEKPAGVAGSITLEAADAAKGNYRFTVDSADLTAKGTASIDPTTQTLRRLKIGALKSPKSNFALSYETQGKALLVGLSGDTLDNSMAYTATDAPTENSLLADFPHIKLDIDLKRLILAPGQPFADVKGTLDCSSGRCTAAHLRAHAGEKGLITATISNSGERMLGITAADAGAMLRALDITDRVYGGTLSLKGIYEDSAQASPLNARLVIEKFNVKQSEVLGRLFGVASLSGLANLLTGSGIDFEKLSANIAHKAGVITITEGRANGASMGYTTEGTVDTTKSTLNLRGVLVPAYMFNSFVNKIPLIGAIAGGEGEGLISFNYAVKGTYADPQVSVNPLSGLTPGFLRNIFTAGQAPVVPGEEKSEPAPQKGNERRHQQR